MKFLLREEEENNHQLPGLDKGYIEVKDSVSSDF